jgi:hypothetical protein
LNQPVGQPGSPSTASRTRCFSGPRNQRASGTAEAHLRAVQHVVRQQRLHRLLQQVLAFLAADLQDDGSVASHSTSFMVHQRLAHLERVRHAGAVDLGVDVADQVGLEVQVLDQRQRVVGAGARRRGVSNTSCAS